VLCTRRAAFRDACAGKDCRRRVVRVSGEKRLKRRGADIVVSGCECAFPGSWDGGYVEGSWYWQQSCVGVCLMLLVDGSIESGVGSEIGKPRDKPY